MFLNRKKKKPRLKFNPELRKSAFDGEQLGPEFLDGHSLISGGEGEGSELIIRLGLSYCIPRFQYLCV